MPVDRDTVLVVNPGADLYGSDRMALETVKAIVASGRRVVVAVPATGPLVELLTDAGARVVKCETPIIRKGLLSARGIVELVATTLRSLLPTWRLLGATGAGTVVVNTITSPLWLLLARARRRVTVCHVHEGEASAPGFLRRMLYIPLVFCHRIVINSRFSLAVLVESAPWLRERTTVVYNAVAGPEAVTEPRTELSGETRVLYVGRLSHRKGPHVAVAALRRLVDEGRDVRLGLLGAVFPGNEGYAEELKALVAQERVEDRVDFLGFKSEVWNDLAANDIAVIPSTLDEPFGNTAVEAALAARPSVVSRVGGLPEAAAHSTSATLVSPADPDELAAAIGRTIDGWALARRRAVDDAATVAGVFSEEQYARKLLQAIGLTPAGSSRRAGSEQACDRAPA